ncbi:MAG: YdeI/OmpD-associated family protein [Bacteroidia bacterium]|nr:YdeI/OmpD-associated family protein [Bacteroidia bacterium]
MNPEVDFYFTKARKWRKELEKLRIIILDSGLTEVLKWGVPTYALDDKNVVLIHVFKEYCAILFFKGALLKDPKNILIQQTKNTQTTKQIRFTDLHEIIEMEDIIKSYIQEVIKIEKSGLKVTLKKTSEFKMPKEFKDKLDEIPALKAAFKALTPGRQRGYLLFFDSAKQSKTRIARIEKHLPDIFDGKGLND